MKKVLVTVLLSCVIACSASAQMVTNWMTITNLEVNVRSAVLAPDYLPLAGGMMDIGSFTIFPAGSTASFQGGKLEVTDVGYGHGWAISERIDGLLFDDSVAPWLLPHRVDQTDFVIASTYDISTGMVAVAGMSVPASRTISVNGQLGTLTSNLVFTVTGTSTGDVQAIVGGVLATGTVAKALVVVGSQSNLIAQAFTGVVNTLSAPGAAVSTNGTLYVGTNMPPILSSVGLDNVSYSPIDTLLFTGTNGARVDVVAGYPQAKTLKLVVGLTNDTLAPFVPTNDARYLAAMTNVTDATHGQRGGSNLHALATSSGAGFLSALQYGQVLSMSGRTNAWDADNALVYDPTRGNSNLYTLVTNAPTFAQLSATTNGMYTNLLGITFRTNLNVSSIGTSYFVDAVILPSDIGAVSATLFNAVEATNIAVNVAVTNVWGITKDPSGFAGDTDHSGVFTFNATNRVLTMTNSTPIEVYYRGTRFVNTNTITWPAIGTNSGLWYYRWSGSGGTNMVVDQTAWSIDEVQCASVYWAGGTSTVSSVPVYDIGQETHGFMPWTVHRRFHMVDGSKYSDGLLLQYTNAITFTNNSGNWFDEDILHDVAQGGSCRVSYRTNGVLALSPAQAQYSITNGAAQGLMYDNGAGKALVPTGGGGQYVNYWIYAVPCGDEANLTDYLSVAGRLVSGTLATLTAEAPYVLAGQFPYAEGILLRRITLRNSNPPSVANVSDYLTTTITATAPASFPHNNTTSRDATGSHPATAISVDVTSFTNGVLGAGNTDVQSALNALDASVSVASSRESINTLLTGWRVLKNASAAYTLMCQGWVDGFNDQSGMMLGSSTNMTFASGSYTPQPSLGMSNFWHMTCNDSAGNFVVTDSSGLHTGVSKRTTATMSITGTGVVNNAFGFVGASDYINIGQWTINPPMSIFTWWKGTLNACSIIAGWYVSGGAVAWNFYPLANGKLTFETVGIGGAQYNRASVNVGITQPSSWNHIGLVYDGTNITFYVNGVADTPQAWTLTMGTATGPYFIDAYGYVGTTNASGGIYQLDDFRIYNRCLSSNSVLELYNSAAGTEKQPMGYNQTLVSATNAAVSAPTKVTGMLLEQDQTATVALNSDLVFQATSDGTNFVTVPIAFTGNYQTGRRILSGAATLASTGTNMQYRVINTNNAAILYGAGLLWQ